MYVRFVNVFLYIQKGGVYSNVLVLQHDKDLIMPGDAAFNLECDFRKPRDVTVRADLNRWVFMDNNYWIEFIVVDFSEERGVVSRITLTDADPAVRAKHKRSTVENVTGPVEFTPKHAKLSKIEL